MPINSEKFVEINSGIGGGSSTNPVIEDDDDPPVDPICVIVTTKPSAPYSETTDIFEGQEIVYQNQTIDGCAIKTYEFFPDSGVELTFRVWSPSTPPTEFFNLYLFGPPPGNALLDSMLNVNLATFPGIMGLFTVDPAMSDSYVLVLQGVSTDDVSLNDVFVRANSSIIG